MAPSRIMFIRHAEKPGVPPGADDDGVELNGIIDNESLTVRGWQRAGALAKFFSAQPELRPDVIFASMVTEGSKSKRPQETVTPLAELLGYTKGNGLVYKHAKDDIDALMADVTDRDGKVLVSWEHHRIPDLVEKLPHTPKSPQAWPDDRFDVVWIFDRAGPGWRFAQMAQLLLAGDRPDPISTR